uniref:Uncharacterized protein n=1 Tax=Guillardia theta TaxID=55529 RepID=A0A7S4PDM4_GUITH|mmetsp:Transcript_48646/g.152728  ORF Transcript_48646/g.152728 Transcript_48646/m.152728 type:complete len:155 (+) Transcript_48646:287-751(+)
MSAEGEETNRRMRSTCDGPEMPCAAADLSISTECRQLLRDWPSDITWCETEPNTTKTYNEQRQSASMALRSLKKARKRIKNTDHALRRVATELNKQLRRLKEEEFLLGDESPLRSSVHPAMSFTSTRTMVQPGSTTEAHPHNSSIEKREKHSQG